MNDELRIVAFPGVEDGLDLIVPYSEIRGPLDQSGNGVRGIGAGVFDYYLAHALSQALRNAVWLQANGGKCLKPSQILDDVLERLENWECIE
jgi:hypothetical protein